MVGLAGNGRGIEPDRAAGLAAGLAELGVLAVAATWAVQRSSRWERAVRRAAWPAVLVSAGLVAVAGTGAMGRALTAWSGPWGWAIAPGTEARAAEWLAALGVLTLMTAAAAVAAIRTVGRCATERHLRHAEGREGAVAALASFDARSARRSIEAVAARPTPVRAAALRRLRSTRTAILWRDAVAAVGTPAV